MLTACSSSMNTDGCVVGGGPLSVRCCTLGSNRGFGAFGPVHELQKSTCGTAAPASTTTDNNNPKQQQKVVLAHLANSSLARTLAVGLSSGTERSWRRAAIMAAASPPLARRLVASS